MPEDTLVASAHRLIASLLRGKLEVARGAALLYEIKVDNTLRIQVDPRTPTRGQSAFQTDLCVFERVSAGVRIPRLVLEFKPGVSTHDVLTYSAKARKHKQIYPYLRYGLVASRELVVPGKFFTHNEALDFMLAAGGLKREALQRSLRGLLRKEIGTSRRMEALAFDKLRPILFRTEVSLAKD